MTDSTKDIAKRVAAAHNLKAVQAAMGKQAKPADPKVIEKAQAALDKQMDTVSRKAKVKRTDLDKLAKKLGTALHPNKIAFTFLFPKAKGFSFADLDFGSFDPEMKGAPSAAQIKQYKALAGGLGRIEDKQAALKKKQGKRGSTDKTAGSDRNFFAMVDKRGWHKIRVALSKGGEEATKQMWDEASEKLMEEMEMPQNYEVALNRMLNVISRGPTDPGMMRNQIFKIADLLKIKLPHSMFASTDKQAKHKVGLPPYESWKKFVDYVQLRERQHTHTKTTEDLKHALSELRGYASYGGQHSRDMKAAYGAVIDAQNTVNEMDKLRAKFDKDMSVVHAALKKVNQIV